MRHVRFCRFCSMLSKLEAYFAPPSSVRGMQVLDKAAFRREVSVPAIVLQPTLCSKFLSRLKHVVLRHPRLKTIQTCVGEDKKVGHSASETLVLHMFLSICHIGLTAKVWLLFHSFP